MRVTSLQTKGTHPMTDINTAITSVATEFARQLQLLRSRCDRTDHYSDDKLELNVTVAHGNKVTFELAYGTGYGAASAVKAATLDALMTEVFRRAGFDDRQAGALQAAGDAMLALPSPSPVIEARAAPGGFVADNPEFKTDAADDIQF
jgi:hypothetical protein